MLNDLLIWCGLTAVLLIALGRGPNGVLTLSYFTLLSISHIPGILAYMASRPYPVYQDATRSGLRLTLIGMAAFVGAVIVARFFGRAPKRPRLADLPAELERFERLSRRFLALGVGSYFIIMPTVAIIPSATSIMSSFGFLLLAALWLRLYVISWERSSARLMLTLGLLPLLPLSTLISGGFLGFGTLWVLTVLTFLFSISRRRAWFYLAAVPAIYLGLSLFVTYMHERDGLRQIIWNDGAMSARLERSERLITNFQLLDLSNEEHQWALAGRLNQNYLIGLMIRRHDGGHFDFYHGATVPLWALIPRAVWPEKPAVGGSGTIVEDTTGLHFGQNTSVGVGQVAEFYINFGEYGVVIGFVLWGFLLMWLDSRIRYALARFDAQMFASAALPGLALMQPLGSLLEILVSFVAALVTAALLRYFGLLDLGSMPRSLAAPRRSRIA
jgi:hypothetical protein